MALSGLPLMHRIAGQKVVVVGEGAMADAKQRLIARAGGIPCSEAEAHQARLAFVALADERAAEGAARRLKGKGLLVNVADRPDLCDFTLPSVLERGPVVVAVGTGGASAGLAKQLRLRLEGVLPQSLGALAECLAEAREALRARWADAGERRRALDAALTAGGPLDPLAQHDAGAVDRWLASADKAAGDEVIEIALASHDPDDLTLRQAQLLGAADMVLHDPAVPDAILARARADAARHVLPFDGPHRGLVVVVRRPG